MLDLSVLIVSYNTKNTTKKCIETLIRTLEQTEHTQAEIIIIDNGSTDGSVKEIENLKVKMKIAMPAARLPDRQGRQENCKLKIYQLDQNIGFGRGNNYGLQHAQGKYILFLNSDVLIEQVNFDDLLYYMNKNPQVGALTVQVRLPNGDLDAASHRGYPTVWRSFTYFSRLEKWLGALPLFSRLFGGYHLTHLDRNTIHEIEAISGAFFLTRKTILDRTGGFDPRFFMYGEDIDLCCQILSMGYKIMYYPLFTAVHLKYQSGIKKKTGTTASKTQAYFYDAMRLFYDKHMAEKNGSALNYLVYFFIHLKRRLSS